jgi:hypothetical protein
MPTLFGSIVSELTRLVEVITIISRAVGSIAQESNRVPYPS